MNKNVKTLEWQDTGYWAKLGDKVLLMTKELDRIGQMRYVEFCQVLDVDPRDKEEVE